MIHSLLNTWNCRLRINRYWVIFCSALCITTITSEVAIAQVCGTPGKDGVTATISGVLNTYYLSAQGVMGTKGNSTDAGGGGGAGGSISVAARKGAINPGKVEPNDDLEYTIYYLNTGNGSAKNVRVCDRLNKNLIFQTQFDVTNSATVGKGISLNPGSTSTSQYLTNDPNDDKGFFSTSTLLPSNCNLADKTISSANLSNNVVVVDLTDSVTALSGTISPGNPSSSFGYIKFKVKVKP
jgi:uncharacterized repeat protein (TIGR01451 family)